MQYLWAYADTWILDIYIAIYIPLSLPSSTHYCKFRPFPPDICISYHGSYRKYLHIPDASDNDTQLEKPDFQTSNQGKPLHAP